ncbi:MAG: NRAMP family divalent metal transporter [Pirellulaceae bacterium]
MGTKNLNLADSEKNDPGSEQHGDLVSDANRKPRLRIGPGLLVTAAFIGPGTIVMASRAGAEFGTGLLWTIVVSVFGAIVLQNLAARVGILNRCGLGEFLYTRFSGSAVFVPIACLVIAAMGIGNSAYQTGNLVGASAGAGVLLPFGSKAVVLLVSVLAMALLWAGTLRVLQWVLIAMVCLLSLAFIVAVPLTTESWSQLLATAMQPTFSAESVTLVIALVGTTIVPYNLFLHASSAASNWEGVDRSVALSESRLDTLLSISLGGVVTASVLLTATNAFYFQQETLDGVGDISEQLRPLFGNASTLCFSIGLFAAGFTSSLTAPLATAYAICGVLHWSREEHLLRFRLIAVGTCIAGASFALLFGSAPAQTILVAQVTNGLMLPIIAGVVLWAALHRSEEARLTRGQQANAILVVTAVALLALWKLAGLVW